MGAVVSQPSYSHSWELGMRSVAPDASREIMWRGVSRVSYLCLGWAMLALGFVGVVVPLMPTTIFLILASWFFARSSPRVEAWLIGHPRFGATLRAWNETGAVPRQAKIMACIGMSAARCGYDSRAAIAVQGLVVRLASTGCEDVLRCDGSRPHRTTPLAR